MKTFVVSLFAVLTFVVGDVQATEETTLEGNTLITKHIISVESVPNVPKGLSAEVARRLVMGELKEIMVKDEIGRAISRLDLPFVKVTTEYRDRMVGYRSGNWTVRDMPGRFTEDKHGVSILFSFLFLFVPAFLIGTASIVGTLEGAENRNMLIFYAGMFPGMLVGELDGIFVGVVVGIFFVSIASDFAGFSKEARFFGIIAAMFVSGFAGTLGNAENYADAVRYCLFLLAVQAASYAIAVVLKSARTAMATKSA